MRRAAAVRASVDAIDPAVLAAIERTRALPSPPIVAVRLLALSQREDVSVDDVVAVVERDPALAAKILRVARSPIHQRRQTPERLRDAVMTLGLNAVFTSALGVTLLPTRPADEHPVVGRQFWERSVLSAAAATMVARRRSPMLAPDALLAGLLADLGILVVARAAPEIYAGVDEFTGHGDTAALERARLGADHAAVGAWMLERWRLPDRIVGAVAASHAGTTGEELEAGSLGECVALASVIVDVFTDGVRHVTHAQNYACGVLGFDTVEFSELLTEVAEMVPEVASIFDADEIDLADVLEEAQEVLLAHQAKRDREHDELAERTTELEQRTRRLEIQAVTDTLTDLANRSLIDKVVSEQWRASADTAEPVAVIYLDVDHFKMVNDSYGHRSGDLVLIEIAMRLRRLVDPDITVGRYGGEEFLVILPGTNETVAMATAEEIVAAIAAMPFELVGGQKRRITVSAGVAAAAAGPTTGTSHDLIALADRALYAAKAAGRDRCIAASTLPKLPDGGR